ncbi:facilitated trehalose transporter Tret1-like isoform X2 [Periplaneta americana]|uniref:facilitated trehalose transporter Tret1-like isoform X2 n=1 Tax=Periplaneta americana TaxID=6978 RepID=UPI0037E79172
MATLRQLIIGFAANLGTIGAGMTLGYSAVALPAMQSPDHQPYVSDQTASWIASLISIGMPLGCIVMGYLLNRLGRRGTLMVVNTPSLLGWILIAAAPQDDTWFQCAVYAGRLLTGFAVCLVGTPAVVYCSEVMDNAIRGVVISWPAIGFSIGILLVYVLGAILQDNWRLLAGICVTIPLISIIAVWRMVPESPVWLVSKGNVKKAETSLKQINKVPTDNSLPEIMQVALDKMVSSKSEDTSDNTWRETIAFLKKPEAYKPLLIFNGFFFIQQFSGIYVIIVYTVNIIVDSGINFDGYLATVLVGVIRLIVAVVSSYLCKQYGRRTLCHISGTGLTLSMGALAVFLSLANWGVLSPEQVATHSWFPMMAILLCVATGTLGFLPLPFGMIGEVFPIEIRGTACGVCTFVMSVFTFVAVKSLLGLKNWMGYHNVFALYAGIAAAGTIVLYFYLPETHGKTLDEIVEYFRTDRKTKKASEDAEIDAAGCR